MAGAMRWLPASLLFLSCAALARAQSGLDLMDVDVMFIGAHPDDDTGILATFARYLLDEGYRGTVVTATGGDGGGNAIGPEAGRSLALVRKEEERRALALVGVDAPSFLGLPDFYFTLSAEETERRWGDTFVCDVVRHVRLQRPEVIVTMWPGPGTHGQHQMAARAASIAFEKASDPGYCPELAAREFLRPFEPSKLYYYDREGPGALEIPTSQTSPSRYQSYAEIKALATSMYRSQGFDRLAKIPVEDPRPERFLLIRSRVPVSQPEAHLLAGAVRGAVGLRVEPRAFAVGLGQPLELLVSFSNRSKTPFGAVELALETPAGFRLSTAAEASLGDVAPGETAEASFRVVPEAGVPLDRNQRVAVSYRALHDGVAVTGRNFTWVRAEAPVRVRFVPLYDVAGYRDFARATRTEWVIESLPTRIPVLAGGATTIRAEVSNAADSPAKGKLALELPAGISVSGGVFEAPAKGRVEVSLRLEVDERALPAGRHAAKLPAKVRLAEGGLTSEDSADLYVLPALAIRRVEAPPLIDGDLSDMQRFAGSSISPDDLWWRRKPEDASDASASFHLAYDALNLYAGVRVRDDVVVCNIAPDDVRAQLRSDAVSITVDPSGSSQDTSTVLQMAAFPCTTAGFGARGFRDADANPGLMEDTAPGMRVASSRTEDGYTLETQIPWSVMPKSPKPGDEIALNLVVYDGDAKDARVGANVSESGIAWAAFEWGGKQALPYLWPRVRLLR
jgi:LmbE family N-acetylglucosaminyl deacetylase